MARDPTKNKGGRPLIKIDPQQMEELAESVVSKRHLAEELGISHDTLQRRLADDAELRERYNRGKFNLRRYVAQTLLRHAAQNPIAAITLANQADILGFTHPNQRVEGQIDVVHSLSPAQMAWIEAREARKLSVSQNDTSQNETAVDASFPDAVDVQAIDAKDD